MTRDIECHKLYQLFPILEFADFLVGPLVLKAHPYIDLGTSLLRAVSKWDSRKAARGGEESV
jgi:hypothetical protein